MLQGLFFKKSENNQRKSHVPEWYSGMYAYLQQPGVAVWSKRDYARFAKDAYQRNVIAHRAISIIAKGAASVPIKIMQQDEQGNHRNIRAKHPLCFIIERPSPMKSRISFFEELYSHRLISGNVYVQAVGPSASPPKELHLLRPDKVSIVPGYSTLPLSYQFKEGDNIQHFPVDQISGASEIMHLKEFNPTDSWYGLSPIEAAAYSIDQHNQAGEWNQSLLQNGARPGGALVVKAQDGMSGNLSDEQYWRIKGQIDEQFSGSANAGRPLLLEGGLDWKEMSMTPKDMDFIECKNSAARDIALAFGVPPQLLGIPGDNTYSNLAEARLALWEQTIIPLVASTIDGLQQWLAPMFGSDLLIQYDTENVSALSIKRDALWQRAINSTFLSDDEKRSMVGLPVSSPSPAAKRG